VASFDRAIEPVLKHEGGYVDHPNDPGGETNFGISRRSYPGLDIKGLTVEDAKAIYHGDFWQPIRGEAIQSQDVASNLLDFAVNAGISRSVKTVQQLVGAAQDGKLGPRTLAAINGQDGLNLNLRITLARVQFYTELAAKRAEFRAFLVGWVRRALSFR
jgi:lysozyme family protein